MQQRSSRGGAEKKRSEDAAGARREAPRSARGSIVPEHAPRRGHTQVMLFALFAAS